MDARAFSDALEQAAKAVASGDAPGVHRHMESALDLYRRPFLHGEAELPPVLAARDRLQASFRRHLRDAGEFLTRSGHPDVAVELYERGVEVDELAEELHQRLLRIRLQLGRRAEGLEAYRRCCEALRRGLGVEPSPETLELARLLHARAPAEARRASSADAGAAPLGDPDSRPRDERAAVAVLPFRSPREDSTARQLADSLAEDLMTDLARISLLTVVGRDVAVAYNASGDALRHATQVSDVPYVLTGSVRRVGERLRPCATFSAGWTPGATSRSSSWPAS